MYTYINICIHIYEYVSAHADDDCGGAVSRVGAWATHTHIYIYTYPNEYECVYIFEYIPKYSDDGGGGAVPRVGAWETYV